MKCSIVRELFDGEDILTLSGGIPVEIYALGDSFDINLMQRNQDDSYVYHIRKLLKKKGISCQQMEPEHFALCSWQG